MLSYFLLRLLLFIDLKSDVKQGECEQSVISQKNMNNQPEKNKSEA